MQPLLSILMPVYNVEKYLAECLDSALSQDYRNVEIICVNDGSTDGSLAILQRYAAQDQRVKVIDKENGGYGVAMNTALDAASGDYVGVLESDDYVCANGWTLLMDEAVSHSLEVVKGCYYRTSSERGDSYFEVCRNVDEHCPASLDEVPYREVVSAKEYPRCFWINPSIWSGVYSREFLQRENVRFNETPGASYQDVSFAFKVWTSAERAMLLPEPIIHYRTDNEFSSSNSKAKVFAVCDEVDECAEYLRSRNADTWLYEVLCALQYKSYIWNINRVASSFKLSFVEKMRADFQGNIKKGYFPSRFFDGVYAEDYCAIADHPYVPRRVSEQPQAEVVVRSQCESPDVSVIVPFFNQEQFLAECIDSVLGQMHENIELVLVDDGSNDKSPAIAERYAREDKRVTLLRQENSGLSASRNTGLKYAKGTYINFLDSDDMLVSDGISSLFEKASNKKLDVLMFDASALYEEEELVEKFPQYQISYQRDREYGGVRSGANLFSEMECGREYQVSACLSLVRRAFIEENGLRFDLGIIHEDNPWTFKLLLLANRASHMQKNIYIRRVRNGSIMTSSDPTRSIMGYMVCLCKMKEFLEGRDYPYHVEKSIFNQFNVITRNIRNQYRRLSLNKRIWLRAQLSQEMLGLLDEMLWNSVSDIERNKLLAENKRLKKQVDKEKATLRKVRSSSAAKIGRVVTYAPKQAAKILRGMKHAQAPEASEKPRILIAAGDARYSGASMSLVTLAKELRSRGEDVRIALPAHGQLEDVLTQERIPFEVFPSWQWALALNLEGEELARERAKREAVNQVAIRDMSEYIRAHNIDLVHSNTIGSYIGAAAAKETGVPHIWHIREFMEEDHDVKFWDQDEAMALIRSSDKCVCISQSVYDKFAKSVGEERLRLVYNGIDVARFYCARRPFAGDAINMTVCANFELGKGQIEAVEAVGKLYHEHGVKNISLNLVGQLFKKEYVQRVEKAIEDAGLSSVVYMPGVRTDMPDFWAHTDIAIVPSRNEAFGRCTVEAMLSGAVVVGSNTAGTVELISDRETGYLYQQGDPASLALVLKEVIEAKEEAREVANLGQQLSRFEYTSSKNAKEIFDLHREVLSKR